MKQTEDSFILEVVKGENLPPAKRVALCNRAYDEDEDVEPLLATYTDPVHVIGYLGDKMVSHALWCTRWLSCDDGPLWYGRLG